MVHPIFVDGPLNKWWWLFISQWQPIIWASRWFGIRLWYKYRGCVPQILSVVCRFWGTTMVVNRRYFSAVLYQTPSSSKYTRCFSLQDFVLFMCWVSPLWLSQTLPQYRHFRGMMLSLLFLSPGIKIYIPGTNWWFFVYRRTMFEAQCCLFSAAWAPL
jgi:hypothetical protein